MEDKEEGQGVEGEEAKGHGIEDGEDVLVGNERSLK